MRAILERMRPEVDERERNQAARCAAGDMRKALDLLSDESRHLRAWTEEVFADLCSNRIGRLHKAAEELHAGTAAVERRKSPDPVFRRRQALRVCDHLAWLMSEAIACREQGDGWSPRLEHAADLVRRAAGARDTKVLLQDIHRLERAKQHIDGNLNIGLVMAGLFEDLYGHEVPT